MSWQQAAAEILNVLPSRIHEVMDPHVAATPDRVALIDAGRIIALDTPAGLVARARGGKTVRFVPSGPFDEALLTGLAEVTKVERDGRYVVVTGTGELVNAVVLALHSAGVDARDVRLDEASLEDAFVRLTGEHGHDQGGQS